MKALLIIFILGFAILITLGALGDAGIAVADIIDILKNASTADYVKWGMIIACVLLGMYFLYCVLWTIDENMPASKRYNMESPREGRREKTIVSVRILDSTGPVYGSRTSTTSAVGRAIVGDMLAGPTGAFIGAATAKQTPQRFSEGTMTFRITWSDGSQTTETVSKDSPQYRNLIEMVP